MPSKNMKPLKKLQYISKEDKHENRCVGKKACATKKGNAKAGSKAGAKNDADADADVNACLKIDDVTARTGPISNVNRNFIFLSDRQVSRIDNEAEAGANADASGNTINEGDHIVIGRGGALIDFAGSIQLSTEIRPAQLALLPWNHTGSAVTFPITGNAILTGIYNAKSGRRARNPVLSLAVNSLTVSSSTTITATLYVNGVATNVTASIAIPSSISTFTFLQSINGSGNVEVPVGALMQVVLSIPNVLAGSFQAEFTFNL